MDNSLELKKRHEDACERAIRAGQWPDAMRAAAQAAEACFTLANRTEGAVQRAYIETGNGWLDVAEKLKSQPPPVKSAPVSPGKSKTGGGDEDEGGDKPEWELQDRPETRFDDIIGMEALKKRIRRYLLKVKNPEEVKRWRMAKRGDGLLLFGPPGTGKTFFAQAVAGELDAAFFDVKGSNLLSKWVGESQKNVARLFTNLRAHERAVLYMDEIDGVLSARGSTGSSVREGVISEFLQAMDGVRSNMKSLLFIGATNLPAVIDAAIISRIGSLIYVPLPDAAMRQAYLERILAQLPDGYDAGIDVAALAARFERCSMRDIRRFGESLADLGISRKLEGGPSKITSQDIQEAWGESGCKPIPEALLQKYERIAQESAGE